MLLELFQTLLLPLLFTPCVLGLMFSAGCCCDQTPTPDPCLAFDGVPCEDEDLWDAYAGDICIWDGDVFAHETTIEATAPFGVILSFTDADNFLVIRFTDEHIKLFSVVGGVATELVTGMAGASAVFNNECGFDGGTVKLCIVEGALRVLINGYIEATYIVSGWPSGHGVEGASNITNLKYREVDGITCHPSCTPCDCPADSETSISIEFPTGLGTCGDYPCDCSSTAGTFQLEGVQTETMDCPAWLYCDLNWCEFTEEDCVELECFDDTATWCEDLRFAHTMQASWDAWLCQWSVAVQLTGGGLKSDDEPSSRCGSWNFAQYRSCRRVSATQWILKRSDNWNLGCIDEHHWCDNEWPEYITLTVGGTGTTGDCEGSPYIEDPPNNHQCLLIQRCDCGEESPFDEQELVQVWRNLFYDPVEEEWVIEDAYETGDVIAIAGRQGCYEVTTADLADCVHSEEQPLLIPTVVVTTRITDCADCYAECDCCEVGAGIYGLGLIIGPATAGDVGIQQEWDDYLEGNHFIPSAPVPDGTVCAHNTNDGYRTIFDVVEDPGRTITIQWQTQVADDDECYTLIVISATGGSRTGWSATWEGYSARDRDCPGLTLFDLDLLFGGSGSFSAMPDPLEATFYTPCSDDIPEA